ncbi:MAG: FtsX-like permease family protein, partial [bacterium]
YIFLAVIMLGLLFGITNTMLMSLLDRIHEFGVLIAVGMGRGRLFAMLTLEALWICCLGGSVGILAGYLTMIRLGRSGIDLSMFAQGLSAFGVGSRLYVSVPAGMYAALPLLVVVTALLSAVYPGIKAVRLSPVRAIRTW